MRDKQLRMVLASSGVIKQYKTSDCGEWVEPTDPFTIGEKVDAIIKFLGINFERKPEVCIAKVKVAPQNTIEAAKTNIQQPKVDNSETAI